MNINLGVATVIFTNLLLVLGAVWRVSALLQAIKSELVHVNVKLDGLDRRVNEVEKVKQQWPR